MCKCEQVRVSVSVWVCEYVGAEGKVGREKKRQEIGLNLTGDKTL